MPFGVSKDFLNLAKAEQRRAVVTVALLIVAAAAGAVVAELLDPARTGSFVILYAASVAAGLLIGGVAGWMEIRAWADSLEDGWSDWMHSAVGAGSMGETADRAGTWRISLGGMIAAVLVVLNATCLVAAWVRLPPFDLLDVYGALAIGTVVATGLTIGARATIDLAEAWWCREVESQTLELVESGRVGVWGYR